ncbi:hypothetical protein, partial [Polynucleobacter sp. UB-Tiil-W10]|uniref:hypothetical protein n=1 Tax=Polynucleobacter sp. UB-Tiil-W10 TaxID=1855648 RepID=UPI001DFA5C42|nr:hypothetical protein [Polynucleobacter sp. UB-Tiil-W10]
MADANPNVVQQAQDAEHLDNVTSLQQPTTGSEGVGPETAGSQGDVKPNNVSSPDGPSLLNKGTSPNDNRPDYNSAGNNSGLDGAGVDGNGPGSTSKINATIRNDGSSSVGTGGGAETATQQAADAVNSSRGGSRGGESTSPAGVTKVPGGPAGSQTGGQGGEGSQGPQSNAEGASSPTQASSTSSNSPSSDNHKNATGPDAVTNPDPSASNTEYHTSGTADVNHISLNLTTDRGASVADDSKFTYQLDITATSGNITTGYYAKVMLVEFDANGNKVSESPYFVPVKSSSTELFQIDTSELHGHTFTVTVDDSHLYKLNAGATDYSNPNNFTASNYPNLTHVNTTDTFTVQDDHVTVSLASGNGQGVTVNEETGTITYHLNVEHGVDVSNSDLSGLVAKVELHNTTDGSGTAVITKYIPLNQLDQSFEIGAEQHGSNYSVKVVAVGAGTTDGFTSPLEAAESDYKVSSVTASDSLQSVHVVDDRTTLTLSSDATDNKADAKGSLVFTVHATGGDVAELEGKSLDVTVNNNSYKVTFNKVDGQVIAKTGSIKVSDIEGAGNNNSNITAYINTANPDTNANVSDLIVTNNSGNKLSISVDGGYDEKTGLDKDGYDRDGKDDYGHTRDDYKAGDGYVNGYDHEGYNHDGKDRESYGRDGKDDYGHTRDDYRAGDGYVNGYDHEGYNHDGKDRESYGRDGKDDYGHTRDDYKAGDGYVNGYDHEGYNHDGKDRESYGRDGKDDYGH